MKTRPVYHIETISQICSIQKKSLTEQWLYVSVVEQKMYFYEKEILRKVYVISTSKYGLSEIENSKCTPLGLHEIADTIGTNEPQGTVFIGRKSTGKIFQDFPDWRDNGYITSRIMRLKGLQEGFNLGLDRDTYNRYVYIHGISNEAKIGRPSTCGCIGMKNADIIELFGLIQEKSMVIIAMK